MKLISLGVTIATRSSVTGSARRPVEITSGRESYSDSAYNSRIMNSPMAASVYDRPVEIQCITPCSIARWRNGLVDSVVVKYSP